MHYHLSPSPQRTWSRSTIPSPYLPPGLTSSRGKLVALPKSKNGVLFLLPMEEDLMIVREADGDGKFEEVMRIEGAGGKENEVLFDVSSGRTRRGG